MGELGRPAEADKKAVEDAASRELNKPRERDRYPSGKSFCEELTGVTEQ